MSSRVPVPPGMVGDDRDPAAKEIGEFGMHGFKNRWNPPLGKTEKSGFLTERWDYFTSGANSSAVQGLVRAASAPRITFTCSGVTGGAWLPKLDRT